MKGLRIKNFDAKDIIGEILEADEKRRSSQAKADHLQAEMNTLSKNIGLLMKEGKAGEANQHRRKPKA